jgi:ATP-binding cassette subfamily B protein
LSSASIRLGFISSLMERSASFGTLVLQAVMMGISGYLAFRGTITIGTFASFQALFVSFSYSFMYLAQYTPNLVKASGGVARIEELLQTTPSVEDDTDVVELASLRDAIELQNVRFSYTGAQINLDDVSLRIPCGSAVALVGPSGSGKSTVLNLLLRFYDPASGKVVYDGTDLRRARQASLRDTMAVVFQEGILFNATVRENIALGRPGACDQEIIEAAKDAEIHDFVALLPDGYDTMAGERGNRFSGGQRQRIAIARAVLRRPSILLLDEATSALDPATEDAINQTLARIARGRTLISVTHRLRSVVDLDRIFLFQQGKLVEQGRHQEMLQAGGLYARMWQKQSGVKVGEGVERATVDAAWLRDFPLMQGVPFESLQEVRDWFSTEHFAADRIIIQQGDPGDKFYILVRGKIDVLRTESGRTFSIGKLQDGDCFGEMALLSSQPRNATVKALTDCVCLSLSRGLFNRLLANQPELRKNIEQLAVARGAL